ncbi:Lipoate synthase, partial [hydrothermal vent metagenome]
MRRVEKPLVSLTGMVLNNGADQPHSLSLKRKPPWLRAKMPGGEGYTRTKAIMNEHGLFTVCEEAACP